MEFERVPTRDNINGTCLRGYLDGITHESMRRVFGPADPDGYWEEEKGYDGEEWTFKDTAGVIYHVYARWYAFRVGSHHDTPDEAIEEFRAWLTRSGCCLPATRPAAARS